MASLTGYQAGLRLLALDGGGIRGVSELVILKELMLRIRAEGNLSYTPRPCDYFDLIGGTSTGGLIALLLGRLQLSVDDALEEYGTIGREVFSKKKPKGHDGTYYATALEKAVKSVVKRRGNTTANADEGLRLATHDNDSDQCKVFVVTRSARAMDAPRLFKSYGPFSAGDYPDMAIWQAARATSAAPTFFKRISIGPANLQEEFIDGGMGTNNPTQVLLKEATRIFDPSRPVACVVSIGTGESSIIEVKEPSFFQRIIPFELINAMKAMITDCRNTANAMEERFQNTEGLYFRFNVDQGLQNIGMEEWSEMGAIVSKTNLYLGTKNKSLEEAVKALTGSSTPSECIVANLTSTISTGTRHSQTITPALVSRRAQREVSTGELLHELHNSLRFDEMLVRENTIKQRAGQALESSFSWVLTPHNVKDSDPKIASMRSSFRTWITGKGYLFWVCGKAASGKSTLMRKVYNELQRTKHLQQWAPNARIICSSMFFTYEGNELQRSREGLLRSLLANSLDQVNLVEPVLGSFLHKAAAKFKGLSSNIEWDINELKLAFENLLKQARPTRRFCFFVDGLDEYSALARTHEQPTEYHVDQGDDEGRKIRAGWRDLAQLLRMSSESEWIKFCVSSRPMNEFNSAFEEYPHFQLNMLTTHDIRAFVRRQVSANVPRKFQDDYNECVQEIVSKASGVFLWVRIASEILIDGIINAVDLSQLRRLLHRLPSELGGPKGLYMRMLESLSPEFREDGRKIFDVVLHARHNLTALILSFAINASAEEAIAAKATRLPSKEILRRSELMEKRLKSCCGGLLEFQDNPGMKTGAEGRPSAIEETDDAPEDSEDDLEDSEDSLEDSNDALKDSDDALEESNDSLDDSDNAKGKVVDTERSVYEAVADGIHINRAPVVQFIHLTVIEFLLRKDVQQRLRAGNSTTAFDVPTALLTACLLRLKGIGATSDPEDLWSAIKDGLYYASEAESSTGKPQTELLDSLDQTVTLIRSKSLQHVNSVEQSTSTVCKDSNWLSIKDFRNRYHWASYQPTNAENLTWQNNFMSLAVQANLTLYVKSKFDNGLNLHDKSGRPLLAYAVTPQNTQDDFKKPSHSHTENVVHNICNTSMIGLLLQQGADPNIDYADEKVCQNLRWDGKSQIAQLSTWQCALGLAMDLGKVASHWEPRDWQAWREAMRLLIKHGVDPNAVDLCASVHEQRGFVSVEQYSPLFVMATLSWSNLNRDIELPRLLVERGASFFSDEAEILFSRANGNEIFIDWLVQLNEFLPPKLTP